MRSIAYPAFVASLLLGSIASAAPPPPPAPEVITPRVTPQVNPAKIYRPASLSVAKIPVVTEHTVTLAAEHDGPKSGPTRAIPQKVISAEEAVITRNADIAKTREAVRTEATDLESKAHALAHPAYLVKAAHYDNHGTWRGDETKPLPANADMLSQSAETYVAAAHVAVKKGGNFNARVARENPDESAKSDAAKAMSSDYRRGAQLYRKSAEMEDQRAELLESIPGRQGEGQASRDKAHNIRLTADALERDATEIETKGVPGATPKPARIVLARQASGTLKVATESEQAKPAAPASPVDAPIVAHPMSSWLEKQWSETPSASAIEHKPYRDARVFGAPKGVTDLAAEAKAYRTFAVLWSPEEWAASDKREPRMLPSSERMYILVTGYGSQQKTIITDADANIVARGVTAGDGGHSYFYGGPIKWESAPKTP